MAKKQSNVIALELVKFDNKIKEFQKYLDNKNINDIYDPQERAKEIDIQIKLMNTIPYLLEQLQKLKEQEVKQIESRGGNDISGLADSFLKNK